MGTNGNSDRAVFESAVRALEAEIANVGAHVTVDAHARQVYSRQVRLMASDLRLKASSGQITWASAAQEAQEARNRIMNIVRSRSSPVGRSIAQRLKSQGKNLNELVGRKAQQIYGTGVMFDKLTEAQKNTVYASVIASSGKSNPQITANMRNLSYAGRGLIFVSMGLSVYTVATADDKTEAAQKEATIGVVGIMGGVAGGGAAGLACGPGAPVCVTLGAFVGGGLSAFGVSLAW